MSPSRILGSLAEASCFGFYETYDFMNPEPSAHLVAISILDKKAVPWEVCMVRDGKTSGHLVKLITSFLIPGRQLGKLTRWGLALQKLDLNIHYHPGRLNDGADALSHAPLETGQEKMVATIGTSQKDKRKTRS